MHRHVGKAAFSSHIVINLKSTFAVIYDITVDPHYYTVGGFYEPVYFILI